MQNRKALIKSRLWLFEKRVLEINFMDFRGEKGAPCKNGLEGLIKSGLKRARVRKDAPLKGDFDEQNSFSAKNLVKNRPKGCPAKRGF